MRAIPSGRKIDGVLSRRKVVLLKEYAHISPNMDYKHQQTLGFFFDCRLKYIISKISRVVKKN